MSIELVNAEIEPNNPERRPRAKLHRFLWIDVLIIAHKYGWRPIGTEPPAFSEDADDEIMSNAGFEWPNSTDSTWDDMDYTSNSLQVVNERDAANIANALEKALSDDLRLFWENMDAKQANVYRNKDAKRYFTRLVESTSEFCRLGAFYLA